MLRRQTGNWPTGRPIRLETFYHLLHGYMIDLIMMMMICFCFFWGGGCQFQNGQLAIILQDLKILLVCVCVCVCQVYYANIPYCVSNIIIKTVLVYITIRQNNNIMSQYSLSLKYDTNIANYVSICQMCLKKCHNSLCWQNVITL